MVLRQLILSTQNSNPTLQIKEAVSRDLAGDQAAHSLSLKSDLQLLKQEAD
jgi:hypothetical protein